MHLLFPRYGLSFGVSWCLSRVDVYIYQKTQKNPRHGHSCNIKLMLCPGRADVAIREKQNYHNIHIVLLISFLQQLPYQKNTKLFNKWSMIMFFLHSLHSNSHLFILFWLCYLQHHQNLPSKNPIFIKHILLFLWQKLKPFLHDSFFLRSLKENIQHLNDLACCISSQACCYIFSRLDLFCFYFPRASFFPFVFAVKTKLGRRFDGNKFSPCEPYFYPRFLIPNG